MTSPGWGGRRIAVAPWPLPFTDGTARVDGPYLVGLGVPFDLDVPAAAHPVVPGLRGPAARVGPQVEVAAPLRGAGGRRIGARDHLACVLELAGVTRTAPGTGQEDHHQTFDISVADGGRALLTHKHARGEAFQAEGGDDLRDLPARDALGHRLPRHRAGISSRTWPARPSMNSSEPRIEYEVNGSTLAPNTSSPRSVWLM